MSAIIGVVLFLILAGGFYFYQMRQMQQNSAVYQLPQWGPLPLAQLPIYFARDRATQALAWEAVRGWEVNVQPATPMDVPQYTHCVICPRVIDFCRINAGKLDVAFNFLNARIERIEFRPGVLPQGIGNPDTGMLLIYTPSGQTIVLCSAAFAQTLQNAINHARAMNWVD